MEINLLIIEDSEDDALMMVKRLQQDGYEVNYRVVDGLEDFKRALKSENIDAILADFNVPGFDGSHALNIFKKLGKDIPFIVVSGSLSGEEAAWILKNGAHDFIDKNNLIMLPHAVKREISDAGIRRKNREDESKLRQREKDLEAALEQTIGIISDILEKSDPYTSGHQKRVSELSVIIAKELGIGRGQTEVLRFSSLIHDIGKIVVPVSILSKPGKLSDIEMRLIRTHPAEGSGMLRKNLFFEYYCEIILQHHERLDGSGYPGGRKGNGIMQEAKIIAVADVVEAMMSHRPYRPALGLEAALDEIAKNSGILYDSNVVECCRKILKKKSFKF